MLRLFYTNEKVDNRVFQWIAGRQPSDGWMVIDEQADQVLVMVFLDGRYVEKDLRYQTPDLRKKFGGKEVKVEKVRLSGNLELLLGECLRDEVIIEKTMPVGVVDWLRERFGEQVSFVVDELGWQREQRVCKQHHELVHIRSAIEKTEEIWERIVSLIESGEVIGMSELALRGKIIERAMLLGCEGESFDIIVATGANSAIPHHQTGRDQIGPGALLVDMGFVWEGWCSDFTRTVWVEKTPETRLQTSEKDEFERVVGIVRDAHATALSLVKPGVVIADIAKAARKVIEDAGYGEYFTHSLGHGVGLDIHEAPGVHTKNPDVLQSGMVITIEPGIYLPGKFGVRWEDIVIV